MIEACIAEFIGTMLLILLGNGVVAGVVLNKTKSHNGGWVVITFAWGLAVFIGVLVAGPISGAHLNPAVTLALALTCSLYTWKKLTCTRFIWMVIGNFLCLYSKI